MIVFPVAVPITLFCVFVATGCYLLCTKAWCKKPFFDEDIWDSSPDPLSDDEED